VTASFFIPVASEVFEGVLDGFLLSERCNFGVSVHEGLSFPLEVFLFDFALHGLEKLLLVVFEQFIVLHHAQVLKEEALRYLDAVKAVLHDPSCNLGHVIRAKEKGEVVRVELFELLVGREDAFPRKAVHDIL